jgi:hypothetical protein
MELTNTAVMFGLLYMTTILKHTQEEPLRRVLTVFKEQEMKKSKLIKQQAKEIESLLDLIELKRKTIQNLLQVIGAYEDGEMK